MWPTVYMFIESCSKEISAYCRVMISWELDKAACYVYMFIGWYWNEITVEVFRMHVHGSSKFKKCKCEMTI